MKKLVLIRRLSQIIFLLVFIFPLFGLDIFFKTDPFLLVTAFITNRTILNGLILSLCLIIITFLIGRFFCGWVCPLGTSVDIIGALGLRKTDLGDRNNARLRKVKFYFLGALFLLTLLGKQLAWIFDPMMIMDRFVLLDFKNIVHGFRVFSSPGSRSAFVIFAAICGSSLILQRFWCRGLCPLGAIYAFLAKFSLLRRSTEECLKCDKCKSHCRTGAIKDDMGYLQGECILCMDCVYDCPRHITQFKFKLRGK